MPPPPDPSRWQQLPDGSWTRRSNRKATLTDPPLPPKAMIEDLGLESLGAAHPPLMVSRVPKSDVKAADEVTS